MTESHPTDTPVPEEADSGMGRERMEILVLLAAAQFLVVLDASITNVALPSIGRALGFDQSNLSWVVNSYVLTFGGFLLLGGRLAPSAEDVRKLAAPVLTHRMALSFAARARGESLAGVIDRVAAQTTRIEAAA